MMAQSQCLKIFASISLFHISHLADSKLVQNVLILKNLLIKISACIEKSLYTGITGRTANTGLRIIAGGKQEI